MATENPILLESYEAAEDLTADQYKFVILDATGKARRPDSGTEIAIGILQNAPPLGQAAVVMELGRSKIQMNGAVGATAFIGLEYVSAVDAGKGRDVSADLSKARAIMIDPTDNEDDLGSCLLIGPVPALSTYLGHTTVTTYNTAGVLAMTAAMLLGGLILRDPNGAGRSDTVPSAASIVAAVANAAVGVSFEFTIRNTADAAETITVAQDGGATVTLSGTMTIAQNNSKRFLAVLTNVTSGSEAVTIYSLGTVVH
jgi:hypothetical protein